VLQYQEALAQELWLELLLTEILWMMLTGNRFYSMTWRGKRRLVKEGYALSGNKQVQLKQLRALHT
jgi:hypothetical protein